MVKVLGQSVKISWEGRYTLVEMEDIKCCIGGMISASLLGTLLCCLKTF